MVVFAIASTVGDERADAGEVDRCSAFLKEVKNGATAAMSGNQDRRIAFPAR
jgi:hypothetical protein